MALIVPPTRSLKPTMTIPKVKKPFTLGTTTEELNRQLLNNKEHAGRTAQIQAALGRLNTPAAPITPATPVDPNPIQPLNTTPLATATPQAQSAPSQDTLNTLFPSERIFEPKNYQGSPLYQFQVQEGQKQLAKSLAAKGLTNSGSAIEQELNIPMRAAAADTDRITRLASENADRLQSLQSNEALRQERAGNNQWDRAYSLAQLMAEQSPWQGALSGLNNYASTTEAAGTAQANFLKDFLRATGGGGGGFTPIPVPSGPNFSNITPAQIQGNAASNAGWQGLLTNFLTNLF